jgi:hypothetical protein
MDKVQKYNSLDAICLSLSYFATDSKSVRLEGFMTRY